MARRLALLALLPALALAGCSSADAAAPSPTPEPDRYPLTIQNCDRDTVITAPPERVIAIKSTSLEMMLALGLADRVAGTAYLDGPVPEQWAEAAEGIPSLADKMPTPETVLDVAPDLIYSGWESAFTAESAGTRDELSALGVASYVQPAACQSAGAPETLDFDEVFREIDQAGAIFGVPERAAELIAEQRAQLAELTPVTSAPTALWWSSAIDIPFVGAGSGAPAMVMDTVGLTNIAGDIDATWTPVGWETIIAANPDVIVVVDSLRNPASGKIDYLRSNPATSTLDAVVHERFVIVPFAAGEAGVRSVDTAQSVLAQLAELGIR
ncbi:putative F420-0 ABC transporter substrate-binding protein [Salinibacterium sp. ZJ70]|uniref:putative F420-0 ABC transporter substrate-binding protein n=1 Tax=Salinibacterium sp. ZJ70 TaxID=2708084 RepID=UPI00141F5060|nr:putative F420-0 ABC transporter substrate-binding protein [Salinibacterium sp. ZJ70]